MDYRRVPSKVINERKLNVIYNLAENTHKAESEERIPLPLASLQKNARTKM